MSELSEMGEQDVATNNVAADELRQFVERIERLEEEKKGIADEFHTFSARP